MSAFIEGVGTTPAAAGITGVTNTIQKIAPPLRPTQEEEATTLDQVKDSGFGGLFKELIQDVKDTDAEFVNAQYLLATGQLDNPAQVGSDRIVIAVAALAEYEPPLTLLDLGTATTIEVVGKGNTYLGGCIIPGVRVSLEALTSRTAQLPGISLDRPKKVIGKNTVDCMRSGIMYGTAAMLDGMLDRVEEELGFSTTVVATGGMAQFIVPLCRREIRLERDLLLKGLNIIYQKNVKK